MDRSIQIALAIGLLLFLLVVMAGIAFNVMALEAYREYQRLGREGKRLSFYDVQFMWLLSPPPSTDPKREAVRQRFLRYQKRSNVIIIGLTVGFGILVLALKAIEDTV